MHSKKVLYPFSSKFLLQVIGLMSGTSMDGINVASLRTDGEKILEFGPTYYIPYQEEERVLIKAAIQAATQELLRLEVPDPQTIRTHLLDSAPIAAAHLMITERHRIAVERFLESFNLKKENIDLIGFPGQTILHAPEQKFTIQIGDGQQLSDSLNLPVVGDFRSADIDAGGQGAPLIPLFHQALAAHLFLDERNRIDSLPLTFPMGFLNIGGVSNMTYLQSLLSLPLAGDCGPGNVLMDELIFGRTGKFFDAEGALAAQGRVYPSIFADHLQAPFFRVPPPKSLDRYAFSFGLLPELSLPDALATLSAFTAEAISLFLHHLPAPCQYILVSGGGTHNCTLIQQIQQRTSALIVSATEYGLEVDFLEAQAFAYLAARNVRNLPISLPTTTGVPHPQTGGKLHINST